MSGHLAACATADYCDCCDGCDIDRWAPAVHYGTCPLAPVSECCGFVECPCRGCRQRRYDAANTHPDHDHESRADLYCEPCRRGRALRAQDVAS